MAPSSRHRQSQPLSPRQLFQNHVRELSQDAASIGHRRNKSISLKYNPYELQHSSSLHVQNHHTRSSSRSPAHSALRKVQEEPDFVLEEREAWSKRSPIGTRSRASPTRQSPVFLIYDESPASENRQQPDLPLLAPTQCSIGSHKRPKTSRGLAPPRATEDSGCGSAAESSPTRSRFLEGSMTDRSHGIASSWMDHASDYETDASDAEEDTTPKASHRSRSGSIDISEFDPPSATSSTVRRTLFRRKSNANPVDQDRKAKKDKKSKERHNGDQSRKRIRKSLSSWSLHGLGEKMGIFNSSSHSVDNVEDQCQDVQQPPDDEKAILDERKRKAGIAYAEQFGTKKQKDNSGSAANASKGTRETDTYNTIRKRSGIQDPDATIKARSGVAARRTSLGPSDVAAIFESDVSTDHDLRKRPTRRELEKENQQLREMLRRSQSGASGVETLRRRFDQPQSQARLSSVPAEPPIIMSHGKVLPPPRLSSRRRSADNLQIHQRHQIPSPGNALESQNLTSANRHNRSVSDLSPRPSLPDLPRSFSMIVEEPEGEESIKATDNKKSRHLMNSRRRHSTHLGDPQKTVFATGKENVHSTAGHLVPTIIVSASLDGSNESRDWQGWDDDVF